MTVSAAKERVTFDMRSPWILEGLARRPGRCRLFCLPFAGGGASLFNGWNSLSPTAEVLPVQLPGRENRLRERPATDMKALLPDLVNALSREMCGAWAVFGHSFGGLLAYEFARAAVRDGYQQPEAVFVSACRPPDVTTRFPKTLHTLSDDELVKELENLGASPNPVLADPETRRVVLPSVRGDIQICETYKFTPDDSLEAPIIAFSGTDDPHAEAAEMKRWKEFTNGPFIQHSVPGGHFFLKSQSDALMSHVKERLEAIWSGAR